MNWLDALIVFALVFFSLAGLKNGLIKTVLSLAGLIIGIFLASRYYPLLAQRMGFISQVSIANIVAFVIILVGVTVLAVVVVQLLTWTASAMMLGWLNRLGGGVFGLVVGSLVCGALLAVWTRWGIGSGIITGSQLAVVLLDKFPLILSLLPEEFSAVRSLFQ
jgi:membrane protein required for colicin V production